MIPVLPCEAMTTRSAPRLRGRLHELLVGRPAPDRDLDGGLFRFREPFDNALRLPPRMRFEFLLELPHFRLVHPVPDAQGQLIHDMKNADCGGPGLAASSALRNALSENGEKSMGTRIDFGFSVACPFFAPGNDCGSFGSSTAVIVQTPEAARSFLVGNQTSRMQFSPP